MSESNGESPAYRARSQYHGDVATHYDADRQRTRYDRYKWAHEQQTLKRKLERLGTHGHVLDAPTGTGRLLAAIDSVADFVVGADISFDMLQLASEVVSGTVPLAQSEAERLPFRDNTFDLVISVRFFQHLPGEQIIPILTEMTRVSRLGVLLQAPVRKLTSAPIKAAMDLARFTLHSGPSPRPPLRSARPANRYFPVASSEFSRLLAGAGLELSSSTAVTWPGSQLTLMHVVRA